MLHARFLVLSPPLTLPPSCHPLPRPSAQGLIAKRDARTVNSTFNLFHSAGYACFWVLARSLVPASGACWIDAYKSKPEWSNVVCAHEPPVVDALRGIVREGYARRRATAAEGRSGNTAPPRGLTRRWSGSA